MRKNLSRTSLPGTALAALSAMHLAACAADSNQAAAPAAEASPARAAIAAYADIAHAGYEDSLFAARELRAAIGGLAAAPSAETLQGARAAWKASRVPYQQTEAYRFGNAVVDDWEGKVNAWPLDEGLIDYVDAGIYGEESDENPYYAANIVANASLSLGGRTIDASTIDAGPIQDMREVDEIEANVATGYHAVEFLLWGQDPSGTGPGAGDRPHTDFDTANRTGGNRERRIAYLVAASDLLIADLGEMVAEWAPGGGARTGLAEGDEAGNRIVQDAVDALTEQTRGIERAVAALGLSALDFEGSDSLDNPSSIAR